jgi:hypothetical protein
MESARAHRRRGRAPVSAAGNQDPLRAWMAPPGDFDRRAHRSRAPPKLQRCATAGAPAATCATARPSGPGASRPGAPRINNARNEDQQIAAPTALPRGCPERESSRSRRCARRPAPTSRQDHLWGCGAPGRLAVGSGTTARCRSRSPSGPRQPQRRARTSGSPGGEGGPRSPPRSTKMCFHLEQGPHRWPRDATGALAEGCLELDRRLGACASYRALDQEEPSAAASRTVADGVLQASKSTMPRGMPRRGGREATETALQGA